MTLRSKDVYVMLIFVAQGWGRGRSGLVRQWLTKPFTGAGRESGSPEMGTETRAQAPRGAAVAKILQYTKV